MTDSIKIGKYIYYALSGSNDVANYVDSKIFPVIAEEGTGFPFIIYQRNNIYTSESSKDGYSEDTVDFNVTVASTKYEDSCEIANEVRKVLEKKYKVFDNMEICDCRMMGISEDYSEGAFVQSLNFQCTITKHN